MRSGGTIAEAIMRFRQSPPKARDEREKGTTFWWQDKGRKLERQMEEVGRTEGGGEQSSSPGTAKVEVAGDVADHQEEISLRVVQRPDDAAESGVVSGGMLLFGEEVLRQKVEKFEEALEKASSPSFSPVAPPLSSAVAREAEETVAEEKEVAAGTQEVESDSSRSPREEAGNDEGCEEGPPDPQSREKALGEEMPRQEHSPSPVAGEESEKAMQALAAQHPKLYQALQSKVGVKQNLFSPAEETEEAGASTRSDPFVEALDDAGAAVVADSLEEIEDVLHEEDILGGCTSEEEDAENKDGREAILGESTTPAVRELESALEDVLEDARSSVEIGEGGSDDPGAAAVSEEGGEPGSGGAVDLPEFGEATTSAEVDVSASPVVQMAQEGETGASVDSGIAEDEAEAPVPNPEDFLRDSGDELIKKVLCEIEAQVGSDVFTSDIAANLELQAMIRRQIESAQLESSGASSPAKSIQEALLASSLGIRAAPERPSPSHAGPEDTKESGEPPAMHLEMVHRYNRAAACIQKAFRSYLVGKKDDSGGGSDKGGDNPRVEYEKYLSSCTGTVDKLWAEVSGLFSAFPVICTQLYQDALLMANKEPHHRLKVEEAVRFLGSTLSLEENVKTYMRAIFQLDQCGDSLSLEQLHSKVMGNLCLKEDYVPDATWEGQLKEAYLVLQSENGKHVFEQLDIDQSMKFSLPRIACCFEILFEASSNELMELCKQMIHYLASKDLWELAYEDVVRAFQLIGNISVEDGASENAARVPDGGMKTAGDTLNQVDEKERLIMVSNMIDAKFEKNLAEVDEMFDAMGAELDAKAKEEGEEDAESNAGSVKGLIEAIDDLPCEEIDAIKEGVIRADDGSEDSEGDIDGGDNVLEAIAAELAKEEVSPPAAAPAAAEDSDEPTERPANVSDGQFDPVVEGSRDAAASPSQVADGEEQKDCVEVATKDYIEVATKDCSTQASGTDAEAQNRDTGRKLGGNAVLLNRAMDRIRLAKKLSHQKKIRDNIFSQIGDLCVDDLMHKLPENCRLKESLEMQHKPSIAHAPKQPSGYSPASPAVVAQEQLPRHNLNPGGIGETAAGNYPQWPPPVHAPSTFEAAQAQDSAATSFQGLGAGINHDKLSNISGKICKDLDNLLHHFERRDRAAAPHNPLVAQPSEGLLRQGESEAPPALPPQQAGHQQQWGWSAASGGAVPKGACKQPFFPFPFPYYGAGQQFHAAATSGASFVAGGSPGTPPPGFPMDVGAYGQVVHPNRNERGRVGGGGAATYSIEDSFQYISKQGWSNANFPKKVSSIENFERDDLKRAYVNTWQQVQAVYRQV
ncbi:hypothetical protein HOP50_16g78670 [Chloropicon primus]|uniref:Uncharacterized protein n=2 Tax=Chloropicon primus TaxID=1764295 RepID=A0A5B8MXJ1_9CHLO|nr:hypothetical protein A3770_16p78370 [Chloropicon primus]UPR04525.1 hypothetical protein HOP50_16g78670 [Chloropicon primus]|eukprot:QDZ25319.1 hypothetical protein A3770_16p78370 [Chloropicon primus]